MYRDGPKTDCSTVLGYLHPGQRGEVNDITTDVGGGGERSHAQGSEKA